MPPTLSATFVRLILSDLAARTPQAHAIFARHALPAHALAQPDAMVPLERVYDALEEAHALLDDPLLGVKIAEGWQVEALEELGFLLYTSATLGDALRAIQQFRAVWTTGEGLALRVQGAQTRLEWWPWGAPRAAHALLGQLYAADMVSGSAELLGQPLPVRGVELIGALEAPTREALEARWGAPVRAGCAAAAVVLPTTALAMPLPSADARLARFFERVVAAQAALRAAQEPAASRVRGWLTERLDQAPTLAQAARALAMSPRTLQRALEAEQTSFRQLIDGARREEAARLLTARVGIEEVAARLGFAQERALWRAFQRWYGVSPARWRDGG